MRRPGPTGVHIAFLLASLAALIMYGERLGGVLLPSPVVVLGAALLYLVSHALRFARLLMLLIEMRSGRRHLLWTHVESAWVGALLPFRLGELFRVVRLSEVTDSWRHGVAAYIVEKFFDAAFLLVIVIAIIGFGEPSGDLTLLLVTLSAVVSGALFVYRSLPGSIAYLSSLLLMGRSGRSLLALRALDEVRDLFGAIVSKVHQRSLPLLALTVLIWIFDLSAFVLLSGGGYLADRLRGFLRTLEGTLGPSGVAGIQAYVVIVIGSLTFVVSGVAIFRLWCGDWARPGRLVRGYQLELPRKRLPHG